MSIREEVLKFLRENKKEFEKKYGIKKIYLFGSVARGEDREDSDIDLMVEFDYSYPMTLSRFFGLQYELEEKFNRKIDLVEKGALKPRLKKYILKDLIEG